MVLFVNLFGTPRPKQVLFLQGGASTQFAAIPLNLTASDSDVCDHIVTGSWSKKAVEESQKYCKVRLVPFFLIVAESWLFLAGS